ncbi:hypothetical protein [Methylococcus mesophilus]|uniref:hypothetical protein n=1 Tax=Methylococcus mesophilus TaxID=2993564 RepID=UPI00224AD12F|nr:hypothetical protein [Methylococcus mesophilus]UZR30272.1 hypothetical protein OOT43_06435 [Methylococcus mesophilus]
MANFNLAEIALALKSKRPGLKYVRAEIAGREVLIVAASLVQLGERIEHVIGQPVGKLLPAEPPARKFEPAPSPRLVSVVDWSGFDPVKFAESLPVHDCAARPEGLAKIEAFRAYQAEQPAEAA